MLSLSHYILEFNFIVINSIVIIVFIVINFHPPSVNIMVTDFKTETFIFIIASKGGGEGREATIINHRFANFSKWGKNGSLLCPP